MPRLNIARHAEIMAYDNLPRHNQTTSVDLPDGGVERQHEAMEPFANVSGGQKVHHRYMAIMQQQAVIVTRVAASVQECWPLMTWWL